jgi:threonyl-tRNA synthetase
MQEILNELEFLDYIYTLFGYTYELTLSTMPEKHLGSLEIWQ